MRLDHIVFASGPGGLAGTTERLSALLGEQFVTGGVHPRFGTRNSILPMTHGTYLEVVEVLDHPASDKAPFGQAVRARSELGGGWLGWAIGVAIGATWRIGLAGVRVVEAERETQVTTVELHAEQERARIARDVHDSLAHSLAVVVSQAHQDEPPAAGVAAKFTEYGLPVATIPYDQGMKRLKISYDGLSPATRRAYLSAAALVARSLHD